MNEKCSTEKLNEIEVQKGSKCSYKLGKNTVKIKMQLNERLEISKYKMSTNLTIMQK